MSTFETSISGRDPRLGKSASQSKRGSLPVICVTRHAFDVSETEGVFNIRVNAHGALGQGSDWLSSVSLFILHVVQSGQPKETN